MGLMPLPDQDRPITWQDLHQIVALINGSSQAVPVQFTGHSDATDWSLSARNRGTGGKAFRALSSTAASLLTVDDTGTDSLLSHATNWAHEIRNSGTGGKGLKVLSSTNTNLMQVQDTGTTVTDLTAEDITCVTIAATSTTTAYAGAFVGENALKAGKSGYTQLDVTETGGVKATNNTSAYALYAKNTHSTGNALKIEKANGTDQMLCQDTGITLKNDTSDYAVTIRNIDSAGNALKILDAGNVSQVLVQDTGVTITSDHGTSTNWALSVQNTGTGSGFRVLPSGGGTALFRSQDANAVLAVTNSDAGYTINAQNAHANNKVFQLVNKDGYVFMKVDVAGIDLTGWIDNGVTKKIGVFGATPIVQPTAYTQTYSTATRTINPSSTSAFSGIATGLGGSPYASVTDLNTLRTDVIDAFKAINQILDDFQLYGWLQ